MPDPTSLRDDRGGWRDYDRDPLTVLQRRLLRCFVRNGYHGATTRMLATAADMSVPGLYHHYPSKQAILVDLMERAMDDLLARSEAALAEAGDDVETRFRLLVECLVLFHAHEGDLAFLAADEIRGLEPEARRRHVAARDRQQRLLDDVVESGVRDEAFRSPAPHDASRAITTMCTSVAQWFRLDGPRSPEWVAELYTDLARRMLAP